MITSHKFSDFFVVTTSYPFDDWSVTQLSKLGGWIQGEYTVIYFRKSPDPAIIIVYRWGCANQWMYFRVYWYNIFCSRLTVGSQVLYLLGINKYTPTPLNFQYFSPCDPSTYVHRDIYVCSLSTTLISTIVGCGRTAIVTCGEIFVCAVMQRRFYLPLLFPVHGIGLPWDIVLKGFKGMWGGCTNCIWTWRGYSDLGIHRYVC